LLFLTVASFLDLGSRLSVNQLWYFGTIRAYYAVSNDIELLKQLFSVLVMVFDHHCAGSRFGINMDPQAGLLQAGIDKVAITWMDVKAGGHVFRPLIGKPVELGALWFNALSIMTTFANYLRFESKRDYYNGMAYRMERDLDISFGTLTEDFASMLSTIKPALKTTVSVPTS
jgi:predicted glycogen debranching enzyme